MMSEVTVIITCEGESEETIMHDVRSYVRIRSVDKIRINDTSFIEMRVVDNK